MEIGDLGFIIHIGVYSFFEFDDVSSVRKRNIKNGSEWLLGRLLCKDTDYRTIAGHKEAKEFFKTTGMNSYFEALQYINVSRETIRGWVDIFVKLGAKYALITSKHHDGVCLWDTDTTDKKTNDDIVQTFKEEVEAQGLEFGVYYSWMEFDEKSDIPFFNRVCVPQVEELIAKYNPKHFCFDGSWVFSQKTVLAKIAELVEKLKNRGCIVNSRLGKGGNKDLADYNVDVDRYIPDKYEENWQHINTIGLSWGKNIQQTDKEYKSGKELYSICEKVVDRGGSLLFNIAPNHLGELDPKEVKSLLELNKLIGN